MKLGTGVYVSHKASFGGVTHVGGQQVTGDQVEDATYYAQTQSMAVMLLKIQLVSNMRSCNKVRITNFLTGLEILKNCTDLTT